MDTIQTIATWFSPPIFNWIIISLYSVNVLSHLLHAQWFGVAYWSAAAAITLAVTLKDTLEAL